MKVVDIHPVDIHPEELIDKLTRGELSGVERERLDAHLGQCSSCRFEIDVRADLEQDVRHFEQRPRLTFAGQQAVLRGPLVPAGGAMPERGATPERGAPQPPASIRPRRRRRWPLVLLAAALVLCAGVATAAVMTGAVRTPAWLHWLPEPKPAHAALTFADARAPHKSQQRLEPPAPSNATPLSAALGSSVETSASAVTPAPQADTSRPVSVPRARAARVAPAVVARVLAAPSVAAFPLEPGQAPSAGELAQPATPQLDPAASLFAAANRARRDGNGERAVELYRSLQARYPSSSESDLSRALLAQLLLDRGSPEAALAGFDRYLAQGAPVLGAEALVGRARALEQLGKPEQAATAWRQVQARFPGSVHARLAATRLAALGMR